MVSVVMSELDAVIVAPVIGNGMGGVELSSAVMVTVSLSPEGPPPAFSSLAIPSFTGFFAMGTDSFFGSLWLTTSLVGMPQAVRDHERTDLAGDGHRVGLVE